MTWNTTGEYPRLTRWLHLSLMLATIDLYRESAGKIELDWEEAQAEKRWQELSTKDKVTDWALRNRWRLFVAGWATSMGVSWLLLQRNKTQTFSQKIVQARVYVSLSFVKRL